MGKKSKSKSAKRRGVSKSLKVVKTPGRLLKIAFTSDEENLILDSISKISILCQSAGSLIDKSYSSMNNLEKRNYAHRLIRDDRLNQRLVKEAKRRARHLNYAMSLNDAPVNSVNNELSKHEIEGTSHTNEVTDSASDSPKNALIEYPFQTLGSEESDNLSSENSSISENDVLSDDRSSSENNQLIDNMESDLGAIPDDFNDEFWTPPTHVLRSNQTGDTLCSTIKDAPTNEKLRQLLATHYSDASMSDRENFRKTLPIASYRDRILDIMKDSSVFLVSGETGSGKTTQLPRYIFEDMVTRGQGSECLIICTQPRRVAAVTIAERVAYELGQQVGDLVGYQVRLSSRCDANKTRILYCTTGVLLRRLQDPNFLKKVSHIVVDEVHERQIDTDFLLTLLKRYQSSPSMASTPTPSEHNLKIVLMSATIQEALFSIYFADCPIVSIPGRQYPVNVKYLDDCNRLVRNAQLGASTPGKGKAERPRKGKSSNLRGVGAANSSTDVEITAVANNMTEPLMLGADEVAEIIIRIMQCHSNGNQDTTKFDVSSLRIELDKHVAESAGQCILVFLSGLQTMQSVRRSLCSRDLFSKLHGYVVLLHGSQSPFQQKKAFVPTPTGFWKVVLATNVAETSITLDGVTHVVDGGFHKEVQYGAKTDMSVLAETFVSQASSRQRAGRAGRVQAGTCWRLYSEEQFEAAIQFSIPEIQRVGMESIVLQVLLLDLGSPEVFLNECPEPPTSEQIHCAINSLMNIRAIQVTPSATYSSTMNTSTNDNTFDPGSNDRLCLTALGYHLARLPMDIRLGRLLINACMLSCVEPSLTIAASLAVGNSIFVSPPSRLEESRAAHLHYSRRFFSSNSKNNNSSAFYSKAKDKSAHKTSNTQMGSQAHLELEDNVAMLYSDHLAVCKAFDEWIEIYQRESTKNSRENQNIDERFNNKDLTTIHENSGKSGPESNCFSAFEYCRENYLSFSALNDIRVLRMQFRRHLADAGFLTSSTEHNIKIASTYSQPNVSFDEEAIIGDDNSELSLSEFFETDIISTKIDNVFQTDLKVSSLIESSGDNFNVDHLQNNNKLKDYMNSQDTINVSEELFDITRCVLCAGLSPNILRATQHAPGVHDGNALKGKKGRHSLPTRLFQADGLEAYVHPSSSNHRYISTLQRQLQGIGGNALRDEFLVYHHRMITSRLYVHDCSVVPLIGILLFSGQFNIDSSRKRATIDKWLEFKMSEFHAVLLKSFQKQIEAILQLKVANPLSDLSIAQSIIRNTVSCLVDSPLS